MFIYMVLEFTFCLNNNNREIQNYLFIYFLQDSHVYATIKESFAYKFHGLFIGGNICVVKNFSVKKNKEKRCIVTDNK